MDITHVLLNNSELGKISKEQRAGEWPVWETNLHNPSFAAFAKLCGGHGARVTKADQIEAAIQEALADGGPALVEIITDAELV
jgi:thiamine pyrophosphate-dependent acetolactate synthase large subunit-like protein